MRLNPDDYIKKLESFLPPPGTSISCEVGLSYGDYLRQMEQARLTFQRGRKRNQWRKAFHNSAGQMPLDLRAYIVAKQFDGDKKTFPEIIPALLRHKDKLHPYILRFLIESLRMGERKHQAVADSYCNIANQFDEKIPAGEP
jgi:hypothetical protein